MIGDLLPSAIGVALSPIPIIAVILILATSKARSNGPAFALGWVLGLVIVSVIVLLVAGGSDDADSAASDSVHVGKLAIGILFLLLAAKQWRSRPQPGQEATMPKFMSALDQFAPGKSLVLGAVLSGVNPKNLALTMAAAASIAEAGLSGGESAVAVAVFVILGSLTVVGPVVYFMVAGDRATAPLASIKQFMSVHYAAIMTVLFLVLGAKLLGNDIAGLSD